ncbi:MAG TPA: sigma-54 dependent transcriptional regulator [Planctomycetota bacterium]|nr:sigma-54 dependent transcriptional regulator [Planctomycetota bacterium]
MKVLLVDDERSIRLTLGDAIEDCGHSVIRCENLAQGKSALEQHAVDCIITDLRLPDGLGLDLLPIARERSPNASLLVITAHQTIETAIQATKYGADYLIKPFLNEEVIARLQKIDELRQLKAELAQLKTQVTSGHKIDRIVGKTARMHELYTTIETVGPSDVTVLVTGESGTGKELVAQALHRNSARSSRQLVKLSCAALPESLLEDELFGHEKGAFTDAKEKKPGRFELADGGSIFLDDIDDMSLQTQVKLLRVLQEREFERLGGTKTIKIDVRVITATKVDLSLLVRQGRFRDDLYFRLRVVELRLPSLRERPADIPLLVQHFIRLHGQNRNYVIAPETVQKMCQYQWPGNVRELENAVMRAIAMAGSSDVLDERHLLLMPAGMRPDAGPVHVPSVGGTMLSPETAVPALPGWSEKKAPSAAPRNEAPVAAGAALQESAPVAPPPAPAPVSAAVRPLREVVADAERGYILQVLQQTNGNKTRAAQLLDISRKNLWEKMRDLGLLDSNAKE